MLFFAKQKCLFTVNLMDSIYLPSREPQFDVPNTVEFPPIGLDFGTTNSVLAHYTDEFHQRGAYAYQLPLLNGGNIYPSVVYYNRMNDKYITGVAAKMKLFTDPNAVVTSVKRQISSQAIQIAEIFVSPLDITTEIISGLLREVKSTELTLQPTTVTMTVPYYFKQSQNNLLQRAVANAFNEVFGKTYEIDLIPEPIAAALDYVYTCHTEKNISQTILIYDIGGGTCDVAMVRYTLSGKSLEFEVLGIDGDEQFGGDDIDQILLEYICNEYDIDLQILITNKLYSKTLAILREAVKNLKEDLSLLEDSNLIIPSLYIGGAYKTVDVVVTRREFNELLRNKKISGREYTILNTFDSAIKRLKRKVHNIGVDALLPIGGTSNIPAIQEVVKQNYPIAKHIYLPNKGVQVSVARGASIMSALKDSRVLMPFGKSIQKIVIKMRVPHSFCVAMHDGSLVRLIHANSPAPSVATQTFYATRCDVSGQCIELPSIELYQGEGISISSPSVELVGRIDLSSYSLYTHSRNLDDIPIKITFKADATNLEAYIVATGVNADGSNLIINETIKL